MEILYRIFYIVFSVSLVSAGLVPVVLLLRLLLQNISERAVLFLWGFFFLRNICPVSLSSFFSIVPSWNRKYHLILNEAGLEMKSVSGIMTGWASVLHSEISVSVQFAICSVLWFLCACGLFAFFWWQQKAVRKRLGDAVKMDGEIYQLRGLAAPVIMGIFRPKIYISDKVTAKEAGYILRHMKLHITKRDALWRFLAFSIVCIYWFNPLMWVCFSLMKRDLEIVRDRQTLRLIGMEENKEYAQKILHMRSASGKEKRAIYTFQEEFLENRAWKMLYIKKYFAKNERFAAGLVLFLLTVWCFFWRPLQILWNGGAWSRAQAQPEEEPYFSDSGSQVVIAQMSAVTPEGLECIVQLVMTEGETLLTEEVPVNGKSQKSLDETLDEMFQKEEERMNDIIDDSEKKLESEPDGSSGKETLPGYDEPDGIVPDSAFSGKNSSKQDASQAGNGQQSQQTAVPENPVSGEQPTAQDSSAPEEQPAAQDGVSAGQQGSDVPSAAGGGEKNSGVASEVEQGNRSYRGKFAIVLKDVYGTPIALQPLDGSFAGVETAEYQFTNQMALYASDYNGDGVQELVLGQEVMLDAQTWEKYAGEKGRDSESKQDEDEKDTGKQQAEESMQDANKAVEYTVWSIGTDKFQKLADSIFTTENEGEESKSRLLETPDGVPGVITTRFGKNTLYYVWDSEKYDYKGINLTAKELKKYQDGALQAGEKLMHSLKDGDKEIMKVTTHRDGSGSEVIDRIVLQPGDRQKEAGKVEGYYCDLKWVQSEAKEENRYAVLTYNGAKAQTFIVYDTKSQKEYFRQEDGAEILGKVFKQYKNDDVVFSDSSIVVYSLMEKSGEQLKISFAADASDNRTVKGSYLYLADKDKVIGFQYNQ